MTSFCWYAKTAYKDFNLTYNIQLKADLKVDRVAIDDRRYSFGMDFDIQETVNPDDYFFIY